MIATVIGSNGYLGKHLCAFLMEKGWSVFGYDTSDFPIGQISKYQSIDISKKPQIDKIDIKVDFIFYLSGLTGTLTGYDQYENFIDINEKGLLHLLDLIRWSKSEARIIFPSTRLVYKGVINKPLDENAEKEFKTIYALNKWFGEQVIQQYNKYFNVKFNIFRICVPFGNLYSNEYSFGTVGAFIKKASSTENIILYGKGDQKRTFTHVEDICIQIYNAILHPQSENSILNINGETFSISEVANLIAKKYGTLVEYREWPDLDLKIESGDTIFNSTKIQTLIQKPLLHSINKWILNLK